MAISRVIRREILDHLPAHDPLAVRARLDLRTINALMGNNRWMRKALRRALEKTGRLPKVDEQKCIEVGAGDGRLSRELANCFPGLKVISVDFAPRPVGLPKAISWRQGDLFDELPGCVGEALVGVMILHHFSDESLIKLGEMLRGYRIVCFCEPSRTRCPHFLGLLLRPFLGHVARHDLPVSIDAGFVPGELPRLLGLRNWHLEESVDWRGSLRLLAWKE
jgi:2-polyprenyl-3-methyl-5-hydroxy-6-metoxy-1,4-benzoquinol methylase